MPEYAYPGVYVAEVEARPHPIPGVPTSVSELISRETIASIGRLRDRLPPEWTDDNQHDPGIALLELAAWIAEQALFRGGTAPDAAVRAARRLAVESLALASQHPQVQSSRIERVRYFEGTVVGEAVAGTGANDTRCLRIVRTRDGRFPLNLFRFELLIGDVVAGGFDEADGLSQSGGEDAFDRLLRPLRKIAGLHKFSNITLKRGIAADRTLADWHRSIGAGRTDRRDVIVRRTDSRTETLLANAWIRKIEGPTLNASANDVAIETLELACEQICGRSPP